MFYLYLLDTLVWPAPMAHSYRLGLVTCRYQVCNPGRAGYFLSWFSIYSAPNCSKVWSVQCSVYHKEPLSLIHSLWRRSKCVYIAKKVNQIDITLAYLSL